MEVNVPDKLAVVDEWRKEMGLCWKEVAYLGGYYFYSAIKKMDQVLFFCFFLKKQVRKNIPKIAIIVEKQELSYAAEENTLRQLCRGLI